MSFEWYDNQPWDLAKIKSILLKPPDKNTAVIVSGLCSACWKVFRGSFVGSFPFLPFPLCISFVPRLKWSRLAQVSLDSDLVTVSVLEAGRCYRVYRILWLSHYVTVLPIPYFIFFLLGLFIGIICLTYKLASFAAQDRICVKFNYNFSVACYSSIQQTNSTVQSLKREHELLMGTPAKPVPGKE